MEHDQIAFDPSKSYKAEISDFWKMLAKFH